jgi:hypothetical protein
MQPEQLSAYRRLRRLARRTLDRINHLPSPDRTLDRIDHLPPPDRTLDRIDHLPPPDPWAGWHRAAADGVALVHRPAHLDDLDFQAAADHVLLRECYGSSDPNSFPLFRLHVVWRAVRNVARVPGDFVEFGSYRGGNAAIILRAATSVGVRKPLHLYDTFSGIPAERATSGEQWLIGAYDNTSVQMVEETLGEHATLARFHQGLIPGTLADGQGPERIAFMHVDLNLSAPTVDALEWAIPRWSPGGICVLDDYLWSGYEDQRHAVEPLLRRYGLEIIPFPTGQGLVVNVPQGSDSL